MQPATQNVLKFPHRPHADNRWIKYFRFFATTKGKDVSRKIISGIGVTTGATITLGYTFFLDKVINVLRFYEYGSPLAVPDALEDRIDEVVTFLKTPAREVADLDSFMAAGFDVLHCGSTLSSYKGWIGIPINFLYRSKKDIDLTNMRIGTEAIDWSSEAAERLADALILTENEQKFALVRAVLQLKNMDHVHGAIIPSLSIVGAYAAAQHANQRYNLLAKSPFLRGVVYFGLGFSIYTLYRLATDMISLMQVTRVDNQIAELGPEMCEAGIDFYSKHLEKNRAIHELSGGKAYRPNGDEKLAFLQYRMFTMTSSKRQQYLQYRLEQYRKEEQKQAEAMKTATNTEAESK